MKLFKIVPIAAVLYVFFLSSTTSLTSCKKDTIIRDTTIVRDTLAEGLVAYYNFKGGSLGDSSGYNNNIIFSNATKTTDRFGNADGAYLFDGSSSYMQIKNNASLNPSLMTMVAIVKIKDFYYGPCHASQIFGKGAPDDVNGGYCLRIRDEFINCSDVVDTTTEYFYGAYGNAIYSNNAVSALTKPNYYHSGQWYVIVYTYDGTQSKIYVNGELKGQQQHTAVFSANTQDLFIGKADNISFPYWFNGVIDEVRIYNRALPAAEVKKLNTLKN